MSKVVKYFYKGEDTDLIVFVKSKESVENYLKKPSVDNLSTAVEVFQVFANRDGKGANGELGEASRAQIANEFGSNKKTEEVIDLILRKGSSNGEVGQVVDRRMSDLD